MNNNELRKVQLLQLKLALKVKEICDRHKINYFLIAGSLLGAVRHNGFIPWDDDLDIGMLRKDYEKFLFFANKELPHYIFLQNWYTDKKMALPYTKLQLKNTKYIEQNIQRAEIEKGIFIDIFPFDNVPQKKKDLKKQKILSFFYTRVLLMKSNYILWKKNQYLKRFIYIFIKIISFFYSYNFLHKKLEDIMKKYNNVPSKFIVNIGGSYGYDKEILFFEWINKTIDLNFENNQFSCPIMYKRYLQHFYGNYLKFPPENERYNRHNIVIIDFGNYKDISDL